MASLFFLSKYDPCYVAGLTDNINEDQYRNGIRYGLEQWVDVGTTLMNQPNITLREAAKLHRVGKDFVNTVRAEMLYGNLPEKIDSLRSPRLKQIRTRGGGGPGALLIDDEIKESILQQHKRNPHTFLLIYQKQF